MTLHELRASVMFQANNDFEDMCEYEPVLTDYINEGYDLLMEAWTGEHLAKPLCEDDDKPALPPWAHRAIADWATWLVYRNGPMQKQQRGVQYRLSFDKVKAMLLEARGGGVKNFFNIPR